MFSSSFVDLLKMNVFCASLTQPFLYTCAYAPPLFVPPTAALQTPMQVRTTNICRHAKLNGFAVPIDTQMHFFSRFSSRRTLFKTPRKKEKEHKSSTTRGGGKLEKKLEAEAQAAAGSAETAADAEEEEDGDSDL